MAEVFLNPLLELLFERVMSGPMLAYISQCVGMSASELKKWERRMRLMAAVLTDAEEKQYTDTAVKKWLDDLRDLAYDVEDILDEFATRAARRELKAKNRSKVPCLVTAPLSKLKFNHDMAAQIEDITSRLDELCDIKDKLGLAIVAGATTSVSCRPPSTCLQPEYDVGRDDEKEKILESLLRDDSIIGNSFNFQVVSIVGLGGIGKTTLARTMYNNSRVVNNFHVRAWACVSQEFDIMRISRAILESLGTSSSCNSTELNEVQVKLQQQLAGKKFLVVLDDVWCNQYAMWEALRSPLLAGALGSKIIVTTRSTSVASMMGSICCFELEPLSDDDCWLIFEKHAIFLNTDDGARGDFKAIREKIVKRCGGLPLAARTLGGLLRCKQRNEWEKMLDDKIWELSCNRSDILPVLRLSYQHLPAHLKRCFAYCAIFPEDFVFYDLQVIHLWMAEGLIQESQSTKEMEMLGIEYFQDLLSRSIFQRSSNDSTKYVMHDLFNALAQAVSGETSFRLEDALTSSKTLKDFKRARHSSYMCDYCDRKSRFEIFYNMQNLRTFLPTRAFDGGFISNMVVSDLLPKLKKLRFLSLGGYKVFELPDSLGDLIHLRALILAAAKVRCLPESTSSLLNLQTLILKNCCELLKLPSKMKDLVNLRYVDIKGADLITEMPIGMDELKSLRTLTNFIVGKGKGSKLKGLKNLELLGGELCLSRLENVDEAILRKMNYLKILILKWGYQFDNRSRDKQLERKVLDMLQPHTNLKELTIMGYQGYGFPSWIGDSSFSNMKVLKLKNCEKCTSLPSLGRLGSLKELTIHGMNEVRMISIEICGESLEILSLKNLQKWEHWDPMQGNGSISRFPRLHRLSIVNCPTLSGDLPQNLTLLEELMIKQCAKLVVYLSNLPQLCDIEIDGCKKVVCNSPLNSKQVKSMTLSSISDSNSLIQGFQKVDHLNIKDCENLISKWKYDIFLETPPMELHGLNSLVELCIRNCPSLKSIPDFCSLPFLKHLEIIECDALTSLPNKIMHISSPLEYLSIDSCNSMTFVVKGQLPASLKHLLIRSCEELQYLTLDDMSGSITVFLDYLEIDNCPSLTCLSSNCLLLTIKSLSISKCSNLTTLFSEGQLPDLLHRLVISDCPKIESVGERFHNHMSLEYLDVKKCENLKSVPDYLQDLNHLREICIEDCQSLACFPQGGFPCNISKVQIECCETVQAPPNFIHNLNSLEELAINRCPHITLCKEEGLPITLTSLHIGYCYLNIYMPLIEWGLHKLSTLKTLMIFGCENAVSFPEEEKSMSLPSSLTWLTIFDFPKLKHLSSRGFRTLTSLKYLSISYCPKLSSFPKEGLPSSLLRLCISECPSLQERCKKGKGREWHKISHIPCVMIDDKNGYDHR